MIYLAQKREEDVRKGNSKAYSLEEVIEENSISEMNDPARKQGGIKPINNKSILL